MFRTRISNVSHGIDLDKSRIVFRLRFPEKHPRIVLKHPKDIIDTYSFWKNNGLVQMVSDVHLENDIAALIDEEFSDETDVVVIDGEYAKFSIALTDLYLFKSMEYNIPNTVDNLELCVNLTDKFLIDGRLEHVPFDIVSYTFKQVLMPPVTDAEKIEIPYDRVTRFRRKSSDSYFHIHINGKKLCAAMIYSEDPDILFKSHSSWIVPTSSTLHVILPTTEDRQIDIDVFSMNSPVDVITVRETKLILEPSEIVDPSSHVVNYGMCN